MKRMYSFKGTWFCSLFQSKKFNYLNNYDSLILFENGLESIIRLFRLEKDSGNNHIFKLLN